MRASSVLQVSLAFVYVRILWRIGPITSSSLSSFQNPSQRPSSWDLVGMPGAIDPCPQHWFISRAFRNKITHILNGNHGPKKFWYQQHTQACDAFISIGTLNIGGLQEAVKRKRLKEIAKDVLVVTETHLQNHLEISENQQFKDYHCFWGINPSDKHFSGIGTLIKRSKFWAAQTITWSPDHPCYKFFQDSRLTATKVWLARGGTSLVVYGIYGVSGARWDRAKKT